VPSAYRARIDAVAAELHTLQLQAPDAIERVLPEIRALTELDVVGLYSVRALGAGWEVSRLSLHPQQRKFQALFTGALRNTEMPLFYRPDRPAVAQRNRVCDATAMIDKAKPGTWSSSWLCREAFEPTGWDRARHLRVLICDGGSLLAWFGGLHNGELSARQARLLAAFVPAMRRRLMLERRLEIAPRTSAALEKTLELIGAPAFVIGAQGQIYESNTAGRALLDTERAATAHHLRDALRESDSAFELTELAAPGQPAHWLAIQRVPLADARAKNAIAKLSLTRRQGEVLALLLRGETNASIAAALDITERAVELHVTALLDRAQVASRAALIAQLLAA
jgi:DNA-binding CsgD family transcriptional regulator